MQVVRTTYRNNLLLWLLALTVGLRSLIAPGFMLETNGDGPLGFGIVLCEGLNGMLPATSVGDPHAAHVHHGHDGPAPEDQTTSGLTGSTTCAFWSTSSTFIETPAFACDSLLAIAPDRYAYTPPPFHYTFLRQQPQQPRAPPHSSLT